MLYRLPINSKRFTRGTIDSRRCPTNTWYNTAVATRGYTKAFQYSFPFYLNTIYYRRRPINSFAIPNKKIYSTSKMYKYVQYKKKIAHDVLKLFRIRSIGLHVHINEIEHRQIYSFRYFKCTVKYCTYVYWSCCKIHLIALHCTLYNILCNDVF